MSIILLELHVSKEKSFLVQFFYVIKMTTLEIYKMYEKTIDKSLFWDYFSSFLEEKKLSPRALYIYILLCKYLFKLACPISS